MKGRVVPFCLSVDLGTTVSAAAVYRDGQVEVCTLGVLAPHVAVRGVSSR